ncbi:MAG: protoporphyrinogen oxidase [Dysgonamonadaceae bacterium]|jgi:oxygen-dependent protoporphyrinogen oxidase|nr:protoporphyrinogen oxidase [Dysgonamonadaceae bacterium]
MTEHKDIATECKDIIIIGAGLTGLSTAYFLKKRGKNVLVVERMPRPGGTIQTLYEGGYSIETGPNTGSLANEEIVGLLEELKNCQLEIANKAANRRLIWKNGKLHALPGGILSGLFTPLFNWKDKFGILLEPFRKKGVDPDEPLAGLARRRLGQSFLDYAIDPFISGIYAGNPGELVTRYALPKLYTLEQSYGSFIKGAIAKSKEPKTEQQKKVSKAVFSVEGGLSNLVNALVEEIGAGNILLNVNPVVSEAGSGRYTLHLNGQEIKCSQVISTVGAHSLPELFPFVPETWMSKINNVRYAPVVQVAVSIPVEAVDKDDLRAFGALIPSKENRKILGILYPSICFKNRSPEGRALLSVFMGGMRHPEMLHLSDDKIGELVKEELRIIYRRPELEPQVLRISRHSHAIPQYEKNTGERIQAIAEFEKLYPGIIIAGNAIDGIGMAHRARQAESIVSQRLYRLLS